MNTTKTTFLLLIAVILTGTSCLFMDPMALKDSQIQEDFQESTLAIRVGIGMRGKAPDSYTMIKSPEGWKGYLTRFETNPEEELVVASIKDIQPVQGWEEFELIVQDLEIISLPDQKQVRSYPNLPPDPFAASYLFRIKDGKQIRYFQYENPEAALRDSWEAQSVSIFGTYLMGEFEEAE